MRPVIVGIRATRRATTLCLAVVRHGDIEVWGRGKPVAAELVRRFGHVLELYTGPRLPDGAAAGMQEVDPGDIAEHRRIRLRRKPGTTGTPWLEALVAHVEKTG